MAFPVAAYFVTGTFLRKNTHLLRFLTKETFMGAHIGLTLTSSYAFTYLSPFNFLR